MESAKVLEALTESLTIGQLAKKLSAEGAPVLSKDLRKVLASLRKEGKIAVEGAKRSAHYSRINP